MDISYFGNIDNPFGGYNFGVYLGNYAGFWNGDIDEFAIYKKVLTPTEIETLYNSPAGLVDSISITYPDGGTNIGESFNMTGTYQKQSVWEKLLVLFESWDNESSCPLYGSDEFTTEYDAGYFHYQSLPFFSETLTATSGSFTVPVDMLPVDYYKCVRCYFISETTATMSEELCRTYTLGITNLIFPPIGRYNIPVDSWEGYYVANSEKYTTSTPLFANIATAFSPLVERLGNFALLMTNYFNLGEASAKGLELGNSVPVARGYLEMIDDFFGGLPISSIFIFFLVSLVVLIFYKLIYGVIQLIKP